MRGRPPTSQFPRNPPHHRCVYNHTPRPGIRVSETALLRAVHRGDPTARAQLVKQLGPRVWALCTRLDPEPEDAYQAAWAHLWPRLHRFDPTGTASLSTWTTTVVHRLLVDRHRRRSVRPFVPGGPLDDTLDTRTDDPETATARALDRSRLTAALDRLPEPQRRIVVLHHIHGMPLADIARTEGIAAGTCKSRLHRARARLAEVLAAHAPLRKAR